MQWSLNNLNGIKYRFKEVATNDTESEGKTLVFCYEIHIIFISLRMKMFMTEKKGKVNKGIIGCEIMGRVSKPLGHFHCFPPPKLPWRIP